MLIKKLNRQDLEALSSFVSNNEYLLPDPISSHVEIPEYMNKLLDVGECYAVIEQEALRGVICGYANDVEFKMAYIQLILVSQNEQNIGYGSALLKKFVELSRERGFRTIRLVCDKINVNAYSFYVKQGFIESEEPHPNNNKRYMDLRLS